MVNVFLCRMTQTTHGDHVLMIPSESVSEEGILLFISNRTTVYRASPLIISPLTLGVQQTMRS